jgi:ligand-binding SRPBCC domain-containing protein
MHYRHEFEVNASMDKVRRFHSASSSMGAITPPPVLVRLHSAPATLGEGDLMDFTMWLGPLPINWVARIENVSRTGFVDRMIRGPFQKWVHRHEFVAINAARTRVIDHVEAELSAKWLWKTVGWLMWLNLPVLFAFRQWKTRRLLQK